MMTIIGRNGWAEGWGLYWTLTAGLATMTLAILAVGGWDSDAIRLVIRATARSSLILFLAAFAASSAFRLWPSRFTMWLRRNRRHVGLGFAMSHLIHALAIYGLWRSDPGIFWALTNAASIAAGSLGYVAIALLAASSFDRVVKAMGNRAWGRLHWFGVWFIAITFIATNGKRIPMSAWYSLPVALVVAAMMLRLVARRRDMARG